MPLSQRRRMRSRLKLAAQDDEPARPGPIDPGIVRPIRLVSPLVAPFPRRTLSRPEKPRTCPQNLAPNGIMIIVDGGNTRASPGSRLGHLSSAQASGP
jgi:hypothetical protein